MTVFRSPGRLAGWLAALVVTSHFSVAFGERVLAMELGTDRMDRPTVSATVRDEDGAPITRHRIEFYLLPEFFPNEGKRLHGSHPVLLGSGTTNTAGQAETSFTPPFTGNATFEARVLATDGTQLASGTLIANIVREASPVPTFTRQPLQEIRKPLGFAILGLVAGLWLFLGILTLITVGTIRRSGHESDASNPSHVVAKSYQ